MRYSKITRQGTRYIPKKGIRVAIDIHDISRHDKKHGAELAISKSKGRNTWEIQTEPRGIRRQAANHRG